MKTFFRKMTLLFVMCSLSFSVALAATEYPWRKRLEESGIAVYTRKIAGSPLLGFKADVMIDAPLERVVEVFQDPDLLPRWYYQCSSARLVEDEGPLQKMCYLTLHLPWPVAERDCVFRLVKEEGLPSGELRYILKAVPERLPPEKGFIRVPYLEAVWRLVPAGEQTQVFVEQHSDPGGSIPSFIANKLVVDMPFFSLKNLRALVDQHKTGTKR